MNRYTFFCTFLLACTLAQTSAAQRILGGYQVHLGYNLYQWQERGTGSQKRSIGQALNVLPNVGAGFWLSGKRWILSLEGDVSYAPFAFHVQSYRGMGALALPVLLKGNIVLPGAGGFAPKFHLGAGVQWQSGEWYFRPKTAGKEALHFDRSYTAELGFGVLIGDLLRHYSLSLDFFARIGYNPEQQWGVYTGLQLSYWDRFGKYNPSRKKM